MDCAAGSAVVANERGKGKVKSSHAIAHNAHALVSFALALSRILAVNETFDACVRASASASALVRECVCERV